MAAGKRTIADEWRQRVRIFDDARRDLVIEVLASKEKEYRKALKKKGLPKYVKIIGKRALD